MKRTAFLSTLALATLLAAPSPLFAQAKTDAKPDAKKDSKTDAKKDAKPTKPNPVQAPDVAAPKFKDGEPDPGFLKTHESYVTTAKAGGVDVLFLGDSITAGACNGDLNDDQYDDRADDVAEKPARVSGEVHGAP